jgi:GGDEF domain-containing protein
VHCHRNSDPQVDPWRRSRLPLRRRGVRHRDAGDRPARRRHGGRALRRSIAGETFAVNKGAKRIEVTISIGLSTLERKGEAIGDVLKRADTALYRAKHDGRNRVVATAA